jgi:hypothetical protein
MPVSYRIIPELGTEDKIRGEVVTGELDFYIKNGNKWALELLRDGSGRKEHLSRIPGKYRNVEADSWLVVDCRIGTIPRTRDDKLCTLVFDNDFGPASATCVGRMLVLSRLVSDEDLDPMTRIFILRSLETPEFCQQF